MTLIDMSVHGHIEINGQYYHEISFDRETFFKTLNNVLSLLHIPVKQCSVVNPRGVKALRRDSQPPAPSKKYRDESTFSKFYPFKVFTIFWALLCPECIGGLSSTQDPGPYRRAYSTPTPTRYSTQPKS